MALLGVIASACGGERMPATADDEGALELGARFRSGIEPGTYDQVGGAGVLLVWSFRSGQGAKLQSAPGCDGAIDVSAGAARFQARWDFDGRPGACALSLEPANGAILVRGTAGEAAVDGRYLRRDDDALRGGYERPRGAAGDVPLRVVLLASNEARLRGAMTLSSGATLDFDLRDVAYRGDELLFDFNPMRGMYSGRLTRECGAQIHVMRTPSGAYELALVGPYAVDGQVCPHREPGIATLTKRSAVPLSE